MWIVFALYWGSFYVFVLLQLVAAGIIVWRSEIHWSFLALYIRDKKS